MDPEQGVRRDRVVHRPLAQSERDQLLDSQKLLLAPAQPLDPAGDLTPSGPIWRGDRHVGPLDANHTSVKPSVDVPAPALTTEVTAR